MTFTLTFWAAVGSLVALATFLGTICLWVLRMVIRDELEPVRQDIETLKVATFNHLTHGDKPDEAEIRARLGFDRKGH